MRGTRDHNALIPEDAKELALTDVNLETRSDKELERAWSLCLTTHADQNEQRSTSYRKGRGTKEDRQVVLSL